MPGSSKAAVAIMAGAALIAVPVLAQRAPTSGPIARYDVRAGTLSGFGAMGARLSLGQMLGGGGNSPQHELLLRLGSSNAPAKGAPKAEHFMPPTAKLGKSVQLVSPREERQPEDWAGEKPRGRILVFWGCGEKAPRGQPVVIDLTKLAAGQMPPGMWSTTILRDWGPTIANSRTFGRWPAEDGKHAKPDTSLLGLHRIAGNYAPEISFTAAKDFMAPLTVNHTANASGSTALSWNAVPDTTGYYAMLFGGKMADGGMGDMVMWSSSASRQFGGGLSDWLTPTQVAGLVRDKTVMTPATTTCTIPAEVRAAAPDFRMGMLTAYGPQEDFAYPPRPADPKAAWNLEWTARIRHRSFTSWMDMPGMPGSVEGQPRTECKPKRGLGGLIGGVVKPGC